MGPDAQRVFSRREERRGVALAPMRSARVCFEKGGRMALADGSIAIGGRMGDVQSLVPNETPMKTTVFHAAVVAALLFSLPYTSAHAQTALAKPPINAPAPPRPLTPLQTLQQRIAAVIAQPRYKGAFWGIKVVSLDSHAVLFQQNVDKLFVPASNTKLFTTALALDR